MPSKIATILVTTCCECPYYYEPGSSPRCAKKVTIYGHDDGVIPNDCPLPDPPRTKE
jgi:hypothetical protein